MTPSTSSPCASTPPVAAPAHADGALRAGIGAAAGDSGEARFPRILLVTQDRSFGRVLREALSFHGLTAILEQEPSPDSALARLATASRWRIRLVLIALPLLQGGLGLLSDIRERNLAPAVPMLSLEEGARAPLLTSELGLAAGSCLARPERWDGYAILAQQLGQLLQLLQRQQAERIATA